MIREQAKILIGKNGLTDGVLNQIKDILKTRKSARISMLKTAVSNKVEAKAVSDKIMASIGDGYRSKLIGHTLVIHRYSGFVG